MGAITHYCSDSSSRNIETEKTTIKPLPMGFLSPKKKQNVKSIENSKGFKTDSSNDSNRQGNEITAKIDTLKGNNKKIMDVFSKKVSLGDFQIEGKLGEGSYGAVYRVSLKAQSKSKKSEIYAMKCLHLTNLENKRIEESIKFEEFVLEKLNHPFLTKLKFTFKDSNHVYLVMECGLGGPVDTMLAFKTSGTLRNKPRAQKFKSLGESGVRFLAANVVLGIEELHRHNIMYRDLKPENIIIFEDGYAKLTDFGLSKFLTPTEVTNTEAGTVPYFAPEMVTRGYYTRAIDFWALGVLLFELATSQSPFKAHQILQRCKFQEIAKRAEQNRDWKGHILSSELKDLINKLLRYYPHERLGYHGFQDIKNHAFFGGIDWNKMMRKQLISPLVPIIKEFPIKVKEFNKKMLMQQTRDSISSDEE